MRDHLRHFERRGAQILVVTSATEIPEPGAHVILKDEAFTASATYGVAFQWPDDTLGSSRPATFVIDLNGVIQLVHRSGSHPGHVFFSSKRVLDAHWSYERPSKDELFAVIDRLNSQHPRTASQDRTKYLRNAGLTKLMATLRDPDAYMRAEAAEVLGHLGLRAGAATSLLVNVLRSDRVGYVRSEAARSLGRIRDEQAVAALAAALKDRDEGVRRIAADALAALGPVAKSAVRALLHTAGDRNVIVVESVTEALHKIGAAAVPELSLALSEEPTDVRLGAVQALAAIGAPAVVAVPALAAALTDKDRQVRSGAAEALGRIGPTAKASVSALRVVVKDDYGGARTNAIMAIGRIDPGSEGLADLLIQALADNEGRVRHAAATTLGLLTPLPSVMSALTKALGDKDSWVRLAAAVSINRLHPGSAEAKAALAELVKIDDAEVSAGARAILEQIQQKDNRRR